MEIAVSRRVEGRGGGGGGWDGKGALDVGGAHRGKGATERVKRES